MKKFTQAKQDAIANVHRAALRVRILEAPAVQAVLQLFPRNTRKDVRVNCSDYSNSVSFSLYMRDLDSLKAKPLLRVLETFATDPAWTSSSSDYTYDTPNRDYRFVKKLAIPMPATPAARWLEKHAYFWHDDKTTLPVEISVFISAYVKQDSDSCRIEVVERIEKVVIEEVKRIVCA
jgi:hypothetical protein